MSYKKPVCECGEELVYFTTRTTQFWYKVNQNGLIKKVPIKTEDSALSMNDEILICNKCSNEYIAGQDDKGRLVRGSEI